MCSRGKPPNTHTPWDHQLWYAANSRKKKLHVNKRFKILQQNKVGWYYCIGLYYQAEVNITTFSRHHFLLPSLEGTEKRVSIYDYRGMLCIILSRWSIEAVASSLEWGPLFSSFNRETETDKRTERCWTDKESSYYFGKLSQDPWEFSKLLHFTSGLWSIGLWYTTCKHN